jgi:sirohydrochlorin cobaltochelatase
MRSIHLSANDALLLIGHGSSRYPDAGSAMCRCADQLREAARFKQVEIALLNGPPSVHDALERIEAPVIRVVPFFMEDGYFSRVAVPHALAASGALADRPALLCPPVGIHDGMAGLIERHALAACESRGIPSRTAAVVVVGHGSASAPGQALALHRHTSRVAATELFARVEAACLEEPPFVADALQGLRTHPVVVIGFFANHGGHVRNDVPALVAAEQALRGDPAFAVRFHGSVTDDPPMIDIIIDQAQAGQAQA